MTIHVIVLRWNFGAATLTKWFRIMQWWLSGAEDIMAIRGREAALFSLYDTKNFVVALT